MSSNNTRPRTLSRVAAVQALFQSEQSGQTAETVIDQFVRHRFGDTPGHGGLDDGHVAQAQVPLFARIVRTASLQQDTLDTMLISALPETWPLERIDPVLRALMRAGAAELWMADGPPVKVVINEYLDVAHGFFSGDEAKLANGVLDKVAHLLRPAEFRREPVLSDEFSRIALYFAPLAGEGGLGLKDDAALLQPPLGRELVLTVDQMIENIHFLPQDPADLIARKLLRRNLSDLAAMGAEPLGYLLTTALPKSIGDEWLRLFAEGLQADQREFGFFLLGGDSSSSRDQISLTATLIGHVAPGTALRRNGARPGDEIWVTGSIGDAALGLRARRGDLQTLRVF